MKRYIALLIAVVLSFILCSISFAEVIDGQSTGKEILFRDIPWGLNYKTVMEKMPETKSHNRMVYFGYNVYNDVVDDGQYEDYTGCSFTELLDGKWTVAGYKVTSVWLKFVYGQKNGKISKEDSEASFCQAQYFIEEIADLDKVSEDLFNKLVSVYGEPAKEKKYLNTGGSKFTRYIWFGEKQTVLSMEIRDDREWYDEKGRNASIIKLFYGWLGADAQFETNLNIIQGKEAAATEERLNKKREEENEVFGNDNTEGL